MCLLGMVHTKTAVICRQPDPTKAEPLWKTRRGGCGGGGAGVGGGGGGVGWGVRCGRVDGKGRGITFGQYAH